MNDDNRASAETESTTEESSSTTLTDEVGEETSQRNDVLAKLEDMTALEICEWSTIKEAAEKNPEIFYDDKWPC
jgi:hypothetical protein